MNRCSAFISVLVLLLCVLGCDSPPWSRCIIANSSPKDMVIRFYTPYPLTGAPCVYTPSEWASDPGSCTKRFRQGFTISEEEKWFEATIPTGGAVEITRYRYPDIEENPEGNFLIDRLGIHGSSGDISWNGRTQIFSHFQKEGGGPLWYVWGKSPRYVLYYK